MPLLTDAEYELLTDVQKIDHWRRQVYDLQEMLESSKDENRYLRLVLHQLREVLQRADA